MALQHSAGMLVLSSIISFTSPLLLLYTIIWLVQQANNMKAK
ncbi:hypothetical protein SD78_0207 [Bacillus badius]|nr:hypothetical protein SD78_0207 [Bacillus badius]